MYPRAVYNREAAMGSSDPPLAVAMGAVGLFAIFHGHAHGSEMPLNGSGVEYGVGFMLATAVLHAVGIGIGFLIGMSSKTFGNNVYRIAGGLASVRSSSARLSLSRLGH
jgi:urease accessory protein